MAEMCRVCNGCPLIRGCHRALRDLQALRASSFVFGFGLKSCSSHHLLNRVCTSKAADAAASSHQHSGIRDFRSSAGIRLTVRSAVCIVGARPGDVAAQE